MKIFCILVVAFTLFWFFIESCDMKDGKLWKCILSVIAIFSFTYLVI